MSNYKDLNDYEIMYMVAENDEDANKLMYDKYKPLIIKMAKKKFDKYNNLGLELDDFIQEGYFGLYSAIKNYNSNTDNKFYTYAIISINSKMNNLIYKNNTFRNKTLNESMSLNLEVEDNSILLDYIKDEKAILPELELLKNEEIYRIKNYIYSLPILESSVLELHCNDFKYQEIADLLDISIHRVGYILNRIRKNKVEKIRY